MTGQHRTIYLLKCRFAAAEQPPGTRAYSTTGGHARILWTLPVTTAEIEFRRRHGHEALEQLFDEAEIIPTDPFRASVA